MEPVTLTQYRSSREDLFAGLGGSVLFHGFIFALVLLLPWIMPRKKIEATFTTVSLVSLQDIAPGPPARKGEPSRTDEGPAKSRESSRSSSSAQSRQGPLVPVKRLNVAEPSTRRAETEIKKMETREAPRPVEAGPSPSGTGKNYEKLIPKPKADPKPTPIIQASGGESETRPSGQPVGGTGRKSDSSTPAVSEQAAGKGNPKGTADGTADGIAEGTGGGGGGRVASALQSLYNEKVKEAVRREWSVLDSLKAQGLETHLLVVVRRDGRVINLQVEKTSGNSLFDESAKRAVLKADPLPAMPQALTESKLEFVLKFRPGGLS